MTFKRLLLLLAVPFALQTSSVFAATTTYYFNGVCLDCNLNGGGSIASLVLEDYTEGSTINSGHLVSFDYFGSNLVSPVTVTPSDFPFQGGSIGSTANVPYNFSIEWEDGLTFSTSSDGSWFICANGPGGYYSGSCDIDQNADFGTGVWSDSPSAVPLPAAAWLFISALSGLMVAKRKSQKA